MRLAPFLGCFVYGRVEHGVERRHRRRKLHRLGPEILRQEHRSRALGGIEQQRQCQPVRDHGLGAGVGEQGATPSLQAGEHEPIDGRPHPIGRSHLRQQGRALGERLDDRGMGDVLAQVPESKNPLDTVTYSSAPLAEALNVVGAPEVTNAGDEVVVSELRAIGLVVVPVMRTKAESAAPMLQVAAEATSTSADNPLPSLKRARNAA